MLLWLMNLDFAGGPVVSGAVVPWPLLHQAGIYKQEG
jgi:hypothetical protein